MSKSTLPPPKVEIQFSGLALQEIDNFRWEQRLPSRASAVRALVAVGLDKKRRRVA
jgi:hypothetical protein